MEEKLVNTSSQVFFSNTNAYKPQMKQIFVFGKSEHGGVVLDPNTMTKIYDVRNMFDSEITDEILDVKDYTGKLGVSGKIGQIDYVVLNGKLCKRTVNMGNILFQAAPLVVSSYDKDYNSDKYIRTTQNPVIFDTKNNQILAHAPWNKGTLVRPNPEKSPVLPFDWSNLGNVDFIASACVDSRSKSWILAEDRETLNKIVFTFETSITQSSPTNVEFICTPLSKQIIDHEIAQYVKCKILYRGIPCYNSFFCYICR